MKYELNVIKLANDDVIATSCRNDIISFGGTIYGGYKASLVTVYDKDFEYIMDDLNSNWGDEENAITDQGKSYHILEDGTVEVCNDPLAHYNNFKDNSDWECEIIDK